MKTRVLVIGVSLFMVACFLVTVGVGRTQAATRSEGKHSSAVTHSELRGEPGFRGPSDRGNIRRDAGGHGLARAREVLESHKVAPVLSRSRARGMIELPAEGFTVEGPSAKGRSEYVVIPMKDPRGDRFATALIYRDVDASALVITVDTSTNELVEVMADDEEIGMVTFDKKRWVNCMAPNCSTCIAGCAFTGPLWFKCTAACCAAAAAVCAYIAMQE